MARPWIRWLRWIAIVVAALALLWAVWWLWSLLSQWDSRTTIAIAIVGLVPLAVIWWLWWRLPQRQVARLALKIRDPKARADVEDNFRKTVGQALGGAAVMIGAVAAYLQFTQQQRAAHDLLISNQVSKGFEQLGSEKPAVQMGGIYALEGVMNASSEYHQLVLEALCAFVRDNTRNLKGDNPPTTMVQAALTVIGRRKEGSGEVNLQGANLGAAILNGANLVGANLNDVDLGGGAYLSNANLTGAYLVRANLADAHLVSANLSSARLTMTDMTGAWLHGANLTGAFLEANLTHAELSDADLRGANLRHANLDGAHLARTKLDGQTQLNEACGTDAELPTGLTLLQRCPPNWLHRPLNLPPVPNLN
jgi:uncharacterized protein YjbI with pentapeptide repeats